MAGHKRPHSSLDTSSPISRPCTARLSLENTTNLLASLPLPLEHFTKLTESITAAHAIVAVKEEELDRARKLVRLQGSSKGSGTKKEEEEGAKVSLTGEEGCWTDVVGIAGGAVHEVLEDLRASRAQLDALGIMVRPLVDGTGRLVDLLKWQAAIPGPVNTEWQGGLFKFELTFPSDYPAHPPKLRANPPLLHHNCAEDGSFDCIGAFHDSLSAMARNGVITSLRLVWPHPEDQRKPEPWHLGSQTREWRLTKLLAGLRYALSHPNIPWAVNERAKLLFADTPKTYKVILRDQAVKQGHLLGDLYARDRLDTRVKRRGKQSSPVPLLLRDPPAWEWVRLDGPYEPNVLNVLADLTASRPLLRKLGILLRPLSEDGRTISLMVWEAAIPGPKGTDWEGGLFKFRLEFPEDYPQQHPKVKSTPPLFHPNAFPSGTIAAAAEMALSGDLTAVARDILVSMEWLWTGEGSVGKSRGAKSMLGAPLRDQVPAWRISRLLAGVQYLLAHHNNEDPQQVEAYQLCKKDRRAYDERIREQTAAMRPTAHDVLCQLRARVDW